MLLSTIRAPKPSMTGTGSGSTGEPILEGSRNDELFRLACCLRKRNHDDRLVVGASVHAYNAVFCKPPLDEAEVRAIIESAFRQDHTDETFPDYDPDKAEQSKSKITDTTPRLNLVTAAEARSRPPMPFLVQGMVPARGVAQLFGPSGQGKTFVVLDLALSVANGLPWLGHKAERSGPVVYVLGEGANDVGSRVDAWLAAHPEGNDDNLLLSEEQGISLLDPAQIDGIIADLPEDVALVVFDTQAIHTAGAEENSAKDMGLLVAHLRKISVQRSTVAMTVHHTGWNKTRERGSSAVRAGLDTVMQFQDDLLTCVKQRGAGPFDPIAVELGSIAGSLVPSINTRPMAAAAAGRDGLLVQRIVSLLEDQPFTLTKGDVLRSVGSRAVDASLTLVALTMDGTVVIKKGPHVEGHRTVSRDLYGLGREAR